MRAYCLLGKIIRVIFLYYVILAALFSRGVQLFVWIHIHFNILWAMWMWLLQAFMKVGFGKFVLSFLMLIRINLLRLDLSTRYTTLMLMRCEKLVLSEACLFIFFFSTFWYQFVSVHKYLICWLVYLYDHGWLLNYFVNMVTILVITLKFFSSLMNFLLLFSVYSFFIFMMTGLVLCAWMLLTNPGAQCSVNFC